MVDVVTGCTRLRNVLAPHRLRPVRRPSEGVAVSPGETSSTPSCSIIDSVSPSMPAAPLFALTRFHASARTSPRQIRSYSAWKRRVRLRLAATNSRRWSCRTLSAGLLGLATMPSRLPPTGTTKAGPSRSSGFHRLHRYYEPLGLPLDTARFRHRLIPAAFARRGPSRRVSPVPHQAVPACRLPYPGSVLRPSGPRSAVCCLRRDMIGSATSPFGFLSHGAAKFTLSHSARRFAPLARSPTAPAGLSTLRSDAAISGDARSLLRGAPALTAAGLPPASLMQHLDRAVQTRPRSGRTMGRSVARPAAGSPAAAGPFDRGDLGGCRSIRTALVWACPASSLNHVATPAYILTKEVIGWQTGPSSSRRAEARR